jgi:hypothetical protein
MAIEIEKRVLGTKTAMTIHLGNRLELPKASQTCGPTAIDSDSDFDFDNT